jgi:predicted secreted protein
LREGVDLSEEVTMMKRLRSTVLLVAVLSIAVLSGLVVSSSAPAEKVNVRADGYAFEPGSSVALELVHAAGAACFGTTLWVEKAGLYNAGGGLISSVVYAPQVDAGEWLGTVILRAADGSDLAPGAYEIRVTTSGGEFVAGLDVVAAQQLGTLGRFVPTAPVCDTALEVHRLVTELDAGASVALRAGDRLMILLAGNPTTGYSWSNALASESVALRESEAVEFRADSELLGAGGFFFFRYVAFGAGRQEFRFVYARPWESAEPLMTFAFSANVP